MRKLDKNSRLVGTRMNERKTKNKDNDRSSRRTDRTGDKDTDRNKDKDNERTRRRQESLDKARTIPAKPNHPPPLRLRPHSTDGADSRTRGDMTNPLPLSHPVPPGHKPKPLETRTQELAPVSPSSEAKPQGAEPQEPAPGTSSSGTQCSGVKSGDIKKLEETMKSTSLNDGNSGMDDETADVTVIQKEGVKASSTPFQEKARLPRMGGAMKKRCLRYLGQGLPLSEALEKAKIPLGPATMPPKPKGSASGNNPAGPGNGSAEKEAEKPPSKPPKPGKRKRGDATNSPAENKGEEKRPREKSPTKPFSKKPSYREVAGSIKLGIMPTNFPDRKMEKEDLDRVIQVTKRHIIEQSESVIKPRFSQQMYLKNGIVICVCKDAETVSWMKIQEWGSEDWTVKEEKDFPAQDILIGYFLGAEKDSNEDILRMVQGQNHNLPTAGWNVVSRKNVKSTAVLSLIVDSTSLEKLQQLKFTVEFGFGAAVRLHRVSKQPGEVKTPEGRGVNTGAENAGGSTDMEQN